MATTPALRKWAGQPSRSLKDTSAAFGPAYGGNRRALIGDLLSDDLKTRTNATYVRKALNILGHSGYEGQLWAYDPMAFGGGGRAAIVVGDLENAAYVAFCVPGTGHSLATLPWCAEGARSLHQECLEGNPEANVAVVYWMGYQPPSLVPQAGLASYAEEGEKLLRRDLDELKQGWNQSASRRRLNLPAPRLTVSGHSYGSATVGLAATRQEGFADSLILLGSPGSYADHAADLKVGTNNVFVGASNMDAVTYLQRFGTDPAHRAFGATRFRADYTGPDRNMISEHSHYYDAGSESVHNIAQIVMGQPQNLIHQNHRTRPSVAYAMQYAMNNLTHAIAQEAHHWTETARLWL
ncbi:MULTISPECIES: alpha/beta hydrolase [unclassified Streptomyces]|uniref:alpha/beta hydrolase n=1 Tax=unclassified Streptomyces TaxID=2593676 RepID=UPI003810F2D2